MMKENIFKYFDNVILSETLNENSANKRTIITDEDELISLFKSDYSEALNQHKQGNNIYRGAKYYLYGYNDLAVMASPGIRVSQDSVPTVDISNLGSKIDKRKNLPASLASQNEVWFEGDAIYMPIEDMYFEWIRDNV